MPKDNPTKPSTRQGKKFVGGYFTPAVHKALHLIAIEEEKTVQALVGEAYTMLLQSRGKEIIVR